MPNQYTLSESDRRLLDSTLREQRSAPPRPAIVKVQGKDFESADSFWALPPCETGLPAAWILDNGGVIYSYAVCCIYKLDSSTGSLAPIRDGYGKIYRETVYNAYPYVINSLVRVHQDKNGKWSNEPIPIDGLSSTTSSTTGNVGTTAQPTQCLGECVWIAEQDQNGNIVWKSQPSGGCRNTTTAEPGTTPAPVTTTPAVTTTPIPCYPEKCRLICLPTTTGSPGTTVWPPSPAIPYRYQQLVNLQNPGCQNPCSCYGVGDPCWLLNGEVESKCLNLSTSTTTTTTTSGPLPNQVCQWLLGQQAGPPSPTISDRYMAGAWSDFRNGGWQVCNECAEGKEPWFNPEQKWDYGSPESFSLAEITFSDIAGQNNPGTAWQPSQGAWKFEVGCKKSPCSLGGALRASSNQAEYRTLTRENIYRYWIDDACNVFGRSLIANVLLGIPPDEVPPNTLPFCDVPASDSDRDRLFSILFESPMQASIPEIVHKAYWSVCKTCPSGTRPKEPPKPFIFSTDDPFNDMNSGIEDGGIWSYVTDCVPGIDCSECDEIPIVGSSATTTAYPEPPSSTTTTTAVPCGCEPPKFCPTVVNECARTRCIPGGANVPPICTTSNPNTCFDFSYQTLCDCQTTTTAAPSTTTTTTASPSCLSSTCEWVLAQNFDLSSSGGGSGVDCSRASNLPPPLQWVLKKSCDSISSPGSILGSIACQCSAAPPTTCMPCTLVSGQPGTYCQGVGSCGDVFSSPCIAINTTTTCAPSANCPNCENGCYWASVMYPGSYGQRWVKMSHGEDPPFMRWPDSAPKDITTPSGCGNSSTVGNLIIANGYSFNPDGSQSCLAVYEQSPGYQTWEYKGGQVVNVQQIPIGCGTGCEANLRNRNFLCGPNGRRYPCACKPPAYPPSGCDWMVFTPCEELRPSRCACCSTTTTTENPCSRHCVYKGDGSGGWTVLSNPCSGGCPCPTPLGRSHDSCEKIQLKCGSRPTTTTTTTTGTGSPTTSTTTTTTARPQGSCCYSGYNPSGCINTWQIECVSAGGTWLGAGTNCTSNPCPVTTTTTTTVTSTSTTSTTTSTTTTSTTPAPLGRCCKLQGSWTNCYQSTQQECQAVSGNWAAGQTCQSMPCVGACCYETALSGLVCTDFVSQADCAMQVNGVWHAGQSCSTLNNCVGTTTTTLGPATTTLAPVTTAGMPTTAGAVPTTGGGFGFQVGP